MMFAVVTLTAAPDHLHGYLNRFLTEVDSGIYVGNISRAVCEKLWERIGEVSFNGNASIIYSDNTREQGFSVKTKGRTACDIVDLDGAILISNRVARGEQKLRCNR